MKKFMRPLAATLLGFAAALSLSRCGPAGGSGEFTCSPNIIDTGLRIEMDALTPGSNSFSVTLCSNATPAAVYTVYAGADAASVTNGTINTAAAARPPAVHIKDANTQGNTFQITFKSTDTYFAIYQDSYDGISYNYDTTQAMVVPHPIPGR